MCCHQVTQLGKLDDKTEIMDIWNSSLAKSIRKVTDAGHLHPVCSSWNSCPFMTRERVVAPIQMYRNAAYPVYLEICLPDKHCNVGGETPSDKNPACLMCRRNFHVPDQPDLTEFLCEKAKPLMPFLKFLCVLGIAEPFWKDAVFKIFEKLEFHRYKSQIQFTTNTNGICLTEKISRRFFEEVSFSDISWSIDAATPKTHQVLRRLDTFDLVTTNLKRWVKMRDKFGGKEAHKVVIYNNINMLNVQEMTQMVELASKWGVDKMVMLPTYDQSGVVQLGDLMMCEENAEVFAQAADAAMARAKQLGFDLLYTKSFHAPPPQLGLEQKRNTEQLVQLEFPSILTPAPSSDMIW